MSHQLSEGQNFALGTVAAFIEAVILQPTLYWKNAKAQNMPFTLDPRLLYRGTGASIFNECQMMGFQFCFTSFFQRHISIILGERHEAINQELRQQQEDFLSAAFGGVFAAVFASPVELIMIQQQRFGGSFISTPVNVIRKYGFFGHGLMRGLTAAAGRDSIYVCGMLGVTPIVQTYLEEKHQYSQSKASFFASMLGGVVAAVPSHPFDVVKTCMQGDVEQKQYKSVSKTIKQLWLEGGLQRMFSGCLWRTINITGTVYIANECRNYMSPFFKELNI